VVPEAIRPSRFSTGLLNACNYCIQPLVFRRRPPQAGGNFSRPSDLRVPPAKGPVGPSAG